MQYVYPKKNLCLPSFDVLKKNCNRLASMGRIEGRDGQGAEGFDWNTNRIAIMLPDSDYSR